jgi:hypothetical protein
MRKEKEIDMLGFSIRNLKGMTKGTGVGSRHLHCKVVAAVVIQKKIQQNIITLQGYLIAQRL